MTALAKKNWPALALGLASLAAATAGAATTPPEIHTYKQVGALAIQPDVYRPAGFTGPRPVLVWIHGGALMSGTREGMADHPLIKAMLADGGVVIAIDYRLAPETQLPAIIGDVEDAFRWVREQGPKLFNLDPDRLVVAGSSAGGYLSLVAGYRLSPRPRALVSYWGYGDLVGPWYREPSTFARHQTVMMSRDEAYRQVSGPPIANRKDRKGDGAAFYQYCRRQGIWPLAVSGWEPKTEPEKFYPYMPLKNVTAAFPPTIMFHGRKDTDVPHENSKLMAAEFAKHRVEHRLVLDPEADHGSNWSPAASAAMHQAAIEFIRAHLR